MEQAAKNAKREKLTFVSCVLPDKASENRFILLAESIRAFAGSLSKAPIWCFVLGDERNLSQQIKNRLLASNTTFVPLDMDAGVPRFPFMRKVFLSAQAESMAQYETDLLVWLDSDTVVLHEPGKFLLPGGKSFGCRPVHHTIIGSRYQEPLDPFWTQIYRHCRVPEDRVFPMTAHVDGMRIRPYFNAGLLVVRSEKRLLQAWHDSFLGTYKITEFQELYKKDERYTVFMHQAVLAGTVLSTLQINEIEELPPTYNYPLHLYEEDVTDNRPSCLEELVTFRYESFFENPEWRNMIPAREPLKQWIAEKLS